LAFPFFITQALGFAAGWSFRGKCVIRLKTIRPLSSSSL
jgi:hypothetical protein